MSIDWLQELERTIDNGNLLYACPGVSRNQWIIGHSIEELLPQAKKAQAHKKMAVNIVRLMSHYDAVGNSMYLVPIRILDDGTGRGKGRVEWTVVETKEAAEMMRDVRFGPAPYFAIEVEKTLEPASEED